jgi:hypothetical protein
MSDELAGVVSVCKVLDTGDGRVLCRLSEVVALLGGPVWYDWAEPREPDHRCLCGVDIPATARLRGWTAAARAGDLERYVLDRG